MAEIKTLEKEISEKISVLSQDELIKVNEYVTSFIDKPTNMPKKLWQTLEKEHLDLDEAISQDEWDEFVDINQSEFAEECSRQGQILFTRFINNTK